MRLNTGIRLPLLLLLGGLVASLAAPACSGCGERQPMEFIPENSAIVVQIPSIARLATQSNALIKRFDDGMLTRALIDRGRQRLADELGMDLTKPETVKKRGVDPNGEAVIAFAAQEGVITFAVRTTDDAAFDKFLRESLKKLARGAVTFGDSTADGVKVTLAMKQGTKQARAAWWIDKKVAVICAGKTADLGKELAQRIKSKRSIKDNPAFANVLAKLGAAELSMYLDGKGIAQASDAKLDRMKKLGASEVWLKRKRENNQKLANYLRGAGLGLIVDKERITLRGFYAPPAATAKIVAKLFAGAGSATDLAKFIGGDALVAGKTAFNLPRFFAELRHVIDARAKQRMERGFQFLEQQHGITLDSIEAMLGHRYAGALYAPKIDLERLRGGTGQIIEMLPFVGMAQVRDETAAKKLLLKAERALVLAQHKINSERRGDLTIYTYERGGRGLLSWTVSKGVAVISTPARLTETLKLIDDAGDNVLSHLQSKRAKRAFAAKDGSAINVNVQAVTKALKQSDLPMELRLMLTRAFSALETMRDLTVSFAADESGVVGEFAILLK
ncbi:MAG: hypothetical protein H6707_21340 [Deltaproteobacteria bacterium]|nr:hypothetical protein [Deltaproteobacteria bacterium]